MSDYVDSRTVNALTASDEDTPLIAMFKRSFRKSALSPQDFNIDPFAYHSMTDWFQAVHDEDWEERNPTQPPQSPQASPSQVQELSYFDRIYDDAGSVYSEPSPSLCQPVVEGKPRPMLAPEPASVEITELHDEHDKLFAPFFSPESPTLRVRALARAPEQHLPVSDSTFDPVLGSYRLPAFPAGSVPYSDCYIEDFRAAESPKQSSPGASNKENEAPEVEPDNTWDGIAQGHMFDGGHLFADGTVIQSFDYPPPVPSSADDIVPDPRLLHSSDSTITDPAMASARIDFNLQEAAFEHATEPVVPSTLPGANIRLAPLWTPIIERRLVSSKGAIGAAHASINLLTESLSSAQPYNPKKRSANECRTPRERISEKRAKKNIFDTLMDNIDAQLAGYEHHSVPRRPAPRLPMFGEITPNLTPRAPPSSPPYTPIRYSPRAPTFSPITPEPGHTPIILTRSSTPNNPSSPPTINHPTPCTPTFKSYPGQFHALTTTHLLRHAKLPTTHTFPEGLARTNANGTYTHTHLIEARPSYRLDYSARFRAGIHRKTTKNEEDLFAILESKSQLAARSHVVRQRSRKAERMRAHIHREATQARMHGVSAGEYRYYDGHMTVEEMVEMGVCVCWERCACSAVCTRFPDMVCPCSEFVVLEED